MLGLQNDTLDSQTNELAEHLMRVSLGEDEQLSMWINDFIKIRNTKGT